jgi:ABC-type Fe3+/spermidine/putrescine transport system ATPase subunit
MRVELRALQRQLGLMFIHVTHNQEEALSIADRVVVMNEARILQVGDPYTLSTKPETEVVAAFMGDNNVIRGQVASREGDRMVIDDGHIKTSVLAPGEARDIGSPASVAIRAAAVHVEAGDAPPDGLNQAEGEIVFVEYLGDLVKLHLTARGERMLAKVGGDRYPDLRGKEGSRIRVSWKEEDVQLLRA